MFATGSGAARQPRPSSAAAVRAASDRPEPPGAEQLAAARTQLRRQVETEYEDLLAAAAGIAFGSVYGRYRYFRPEEYLSFAYVRLAAHLDAASSVDDLRTRLATCLRTPYIVQTMRNCARDLSRPLSNEQPTWDGSEPGAVADGDPSVDHTADARTMATLVAELRERATRDEPARTALTDRHIACWLAVLSEDRGAQAELARRYGLDRSRITQLKHDGRWKVMQAVYVAGVLAAPGTLKDPEKIRACLDAYDGLDGTGPTAEQRAHLESGSLAVTTTEAEGQRVDHRQAAQLHLQRRRQRAARDRVRTGEQTLDGYVAEFAETLHDAESRHAAAVRNPHPNCTLACDRHNPRRDRVIWDVEL